MSSSSILILLITTILTFSDGVNPESIRDYSGYSVFRVTPQSSSQIAYLRRLEKELATYSAPFDVDFWKSPSRVGESVDIMLKSSASGYVLDGLEEMGLTPSFRIKDVGEKIRLQQLESRQDGSTDDFFADYRRLEDINRHFDRLHSMSPSFSRIEVIGKSFEGRDLRVFVINRDQSVDRPIVWIDGGTHAREWIGPATVSYFATLLTQAENACRRQDQENSRRKFFSNPRVRGSSTSHRQQPQIVDMTNNTCSPSMHRLLSTFEFRLLPVVNPDGYVFAHDSDRLWRKTRSDSGLTPWTLFCKGTDPNRNYESPKWAGEGSSGNPCAQTYAGRRPHSEPEVAAVTEQIRRIGGKDRVRFFLTLHSYSQIMLLPFGHSAEPIPPDYPDIERLAMIGAKELISVHGTNYSIGSGARILYPASGTASDWAYETAGIKYSYTFELPDQGEEGFLLNRDRIKPVGEETWRAVEAMLTELTF